MGTLAIDLGNSTTVVAFQAIGDKVPILLNLPPITRIAGEIPSLIYCENIGSKSYCFGQEVKELQPKIKNNHLISRDFKRWIGSTSKERIYKSNIPPEKAGELLLKEIWTKVSPTFEVKRLVLTAPVETYRDYRAWLLKVCGELPVPEIALVDEPTAAALGSGLEAGSKLLVVDFGGSTIDLSLVAIEGGEGRAEPIAQLIRFGGQDLIDTSKQVDRTAKVLGKAGMQLGGSDIDRWIVNHLLPNEELSVDLLNAAERLKCKLSDDDLEDMKIITEPCLQIDSSEKNFELKLSRSQLEELLIKKDFLICLKSLLDNTLAGGRANGCELESLKGVVVVGGGARIPLLKKWLKKNCAPAPLITPPPIEAVVQGALKLTPGVSIRDILQRGVCLRCWDPRSKKHIWHPLFLAGQPWPTSKSFEIILAASKPDQKELELQLGESDISGTNEVIYIDGVPTIKEAKTKSYFKPWSNNPISLALNPPGQPGEDCLRLSFIIDETCGLQVDGVDIRTGEKIPKEFLGSVR